MEVDFEKTVFFDFQKPSKIKGFRLRTRETANRILSPPRLPIPTHRQVYFDETDSKRPWKNEVGQEVDFEKNVILNYQNPLYIKGFRLRD